jgi:K+-transporting ATPase ATPase C chain
MGNALLQAPRVARARGLSEETVQRKIAARTEGRFLGIFGEPRVNVLLLNLDMDEGK